MSTNFKERLINSLHEASRFDSGYLVKPLAILWPDPDKQWEPIIGTLQNDMPELLVFGKYQPERKTGPAIWLKCMVARALPEANWDELLTPIVYLPGISKNDLKNLANADPQLAPLMEYQYTGNIWTHRNGKEWTVMAFLQNKEEGMGLNMALDNLTKDAALKSLQAMVEEGGINYPPLVNSDFLFQLLFPNDVKIVLDWMCQGDTWLNKLESDMQHVFRSICKNKYNFYPDPKNIRAIAENLGMKTGNWAKIWDYYRIAPSRFPQIRDLLNISKPEDMGIGGLYAIPEDSWPSINQTQEETLKEGLLSIKDLYQKNAIKKIQELEKIHDKRRSWVWADLGEANLAKSLKYLKELSEKVETTYPSKNIDDLRIYYEDQGFEVDFAAIKALTEAKSEKEKEAVKAVLTAVYTPWVNELTRKFQKVVGENLDFFASIEIKEESEEYIVFVDAFRYDLAKKWVNFLNQKNYKVTFGSRFIPLPSLTPTVKPFISPVASVISQESHCKDFSPQTAGKKDLTPHQFEVELNEMGYKMVNDAGEIQNPGKYWMEIGKIDKHGHEEQSNMVYRINDLLTLIEEKMEDIFNKGIKKIKIVTDHGWLLIPGGMPKETLPKDHIETRWGRCAVLKEGVPSELLHLPWYWNKSVMIAYTPGISFFKINQEYAHGGVSLQECLVPVITVESNKTILRKIDINYKWTGLKCSVEVSGVEAGYMIDLRTRYNDEKSSILREKKTLPGEGKISLFVEEIKHESEAAFIVITNKEGIILEKIQTIVGE